MVKRSRWHLEVDGPMTLERIRERHRPPPPCRVSLYRYQPGDEYQGESRPATVYVMRGSLVIECEGRVESIAEGEILSFDGGRYQVRSSSVEVSEAVWTWDLSDLLN